MIMRIPILKSILRNLDWFEEARRHHVAPDGSILLGGTNHRLKKAGNWEESKHPRADDGKFTSGSGGGSKKPSKTKRKLERRAEAASQGRVSGAIQTLLSGGSALDKIGWLNTSKPKEPEKKPVEEKKPEQQRLPKYEDIPGAERLVGGPGVIPFSTDKYGGWNGLYHSHDQKVIGKMENGLLRLDVYDAKSNKLLSSAKFDLKEDKNFGTNVKGKHGNVKINYLKVNKIPEGFPAYTDRAAIDRKLEVDEYIGNTRESIASTHPDMQRLAIHLDENGKIKSHQLIPITATVQDENAIYVPAFGNEAKAKRAIEDALLHGKYTKGRQGAPKQQEKPKAEEKPRPADKVKSAKDTIQENLKSGKLKRETVIAAVMSLHEQASAAKAKGDFKSSKDLMFQANVMIDAAEIKSYELIPSKRQNTPSQKPANTRRNPGNDPFAGDPLHDPLPRGYRVRSPEETERYMREHPYKPPKGDDYEADYKRRTGRDWDPTTA